MDLGFDFLCLFGTVEVKAMGHAFKDEELMPDLLLLHKRIKLCDIREEYLFTATDDGDVLQLLRVSVDRRNMSIFQS